MSSDNDHESFFDWSMCHMLGVENSPPTGKYPSWAGVLAKKRIVSDRGLGDTIERMTARYGIQLIMHAFTRITQKECHCEDRREKLNRWYPYDQQEMT